MMFEYHGNDKAVKSLNEAKINENENGTEISIRLDFSNISTAVSNIESATLTLPAYLSISQVNGNSNGVPTHNGSKVTITNISTARPLELSLKTQKLDFTNNQNDHGRLSINNGAIDLTGYFSIAMQCNVTGAMPDNPTIKAKIGVADRTITMNSATGIFDPKINLNTLGEVDVTGLPDFLDDDDVVADLDNPQILLTVNNNMDVAATVSATVISTKEGRELARVTLPEMSVAKNGPSKICICRQKTSELTQQYGEANVYAVSNLSTLINRIPDHIKIVDVNAHAKPEVATIVFGEKYRVKPSYEVNAPLAFWRKGKYRLRRLFYRMERRYRRTRLGRGNLHRGDSQRREQGSSVPHRKSISCRRTGQQDRRQTAHRDSRRGGCIDRRNNSRNNTYHHENYTQGKELAQAVGRTRIPTGRLRQVSQWQQGDGHLPQRERAYPETERHQGEDCRKDYRRLQLMRASDQTYLFYI